jgi:hypothetical protein
MGMTEPTWTTGEVMGHSSDRLKRPVILPYMCIDQSSSLALIQEPFSGPFPLPSPLI